MKNDSRLCRVGIKPFLVGLIVIFCSFGCGSKQILRTEKYVLNHVNPFIGTTATGNTFPGAVLPSGMAAPSPHNIYAKDLGHSTQTGIYIHGEPYIYGFGQTHLSGVGCHIMGNVVINPSTGELEPDPRKNRSAYQNETASPGYYAVDLIDSKVNVELTTSMRVGVNKFSFPAGQANVTLDMSHPVNSVNGGQIKIISDTEIVGYEIDGGFCGNEMRHKVFYVIQFDSPADRSGYYINGALVSKSDQMEVSGENVGAYFSFDLNEPKEVVVKVGISYVSVENARKNIEMEVPHYDFDRVLSDAKSVWSERLGRILVEGGTLEEKEVFYSALYHSLILPFELNDANGDYPSYSSHDSKILPFVARYDTAGINKPYTVLNNQDTRYSAMSLWDTYRTTHPLYALVYPELQSRIVKSMIGMYEESGRLPLWPLIDQECGCMVGDPSTIVIADTYMKGIRDYDLDKAYEAMVSNANSPDEGGNGLRAGGSAYVRDGYIPEDKKLDLRVWGSVSTALEYAHADAALAQVSREMGKLEDYKKYWNRSLAYKQYWNEETGFLRAKNSDGSWLKPFDPLSTAGEIEGFDHLGGLGYVEGNAWQYLFFVPHDIPGLMATMGGSEAFLTKLQECFDQDLFVLWNEPDMGYPYLFNYIEGEEWRTQKYVQQSLARHFKASPSGLPGNDDAGTLSCWAVFSMLGIYPDCPGTPRYQLSTPVFDRITIKLDSRYYTGDQIVITKTGGKSKGEFERIASIALNDNSHNSYQIQHSDLVSGAELAFTLE